MNIFKFFWQLFLIYALYQFVFKFILPLYRTSKKMKSTFNDIQNKMKEHQDFQQHNYNTAQPQNKKPTQTAAGDYIDYEEVK